MPYLAFGAVGLLALAVGTGFKWAGEGVEDTADGISKMIVVGTVVSGAYLVAKKAKVI